VVVFQADPRMVAVNENSRTRMPTQYEQDDAKRRIRVTVTGTLTIGDLLELLERQLAGGGWRYGLLVDARAPLVPASTGEMQSFASRLTDLVAAHGPRGPVAVVARDPRMIGSIQRHAFSAAKIQSIEVFWDLEEAQRWLDGRLAQTRETPESR
jgi:hypothetical protein